MKLNLSLTLADFRNIICFEQAVKKQIGRNNYIGTHSLCLWYYFPNHEVLGKMFHPKPTTKIYEYELESSSLLPKLTLVYTENDFKSRRDFDKATEKQVGKSGVILSGFYNWSLAFNFDYTKELRDVLAPSGEKILLLRSTKPEDLNVIPLELESSFVAPPPTK